LVLGTYRGIARGLLVVKRDLLQCQKRPAAMQDRRSSSGYSRIVKSAIMAKIIALKSPIALAHFFACPAHCAHT